MDIKIYAKLTETGALEVAGKSIILTLNGAEMRICNPTEAQYLAAGYLPVRLADKPTAPEGKRAVAVYTMGEGEILQDWTLEDWVDTRVDTAKLSAQISALEEQLTAAKILLGVE